MTGRGRRIRSRSAAGPENEKAREAFCTVLRFPFSFSIRLFEPVRPAFVDAHVEVDEDLVAGDEFELLARGAADAADL
jgi:hypothetical protein